MKIGINLVGVSYNNGSTGGRYRNFEDAKDGLFTYVVNPLIEQGHEVSFHLCSYENEKQNDILIAYKPTTHLFVNPKYNIAGGGDKVIPGMKIMSHLYTQSLALLLLQPLDLVISTRFDINFFKNPFTEYEYDFTKCNFLWREPEFMHIPIVNDTFIVFPHSMTSDLITAINIMETDPPFGCNIGMHNLYVPMVSQVGEENVQWMDDEFKTAIENDYIN